MRSLLVVLPLLLAQDPGAYRPSLRLDLPTELREVSCLTDVDKHTVGCLQDEQATLYFLDVRTGVITGRHAFAGAGDMEGLTRVGQHYYALRSDGLVYTFSFANNRISAPDSFALRLPHGNIEGLAYDERMKRVLVAPKDVVKGDKGARDKRDVYAFDPATRALLTEPVLSFSVSSLLQQATTRGMSIPMRSTPKGREVPDIKLRMSSIAVDPVSDHFYILSAVDHALFVVDRKGGLVDLVVLDPRELPKPEGITFMPGGDMIITSEGKDSPPRLVRYAR